MIRNIDFEKVAKELSSETLLRILNDLADANGFSKIWESANTVAIIKDELEKRDNGKAQLPQMQ